MRGSRCSWPAISWELPFFAGIPRPGVHRHTGSIAATLEPGADVVLGALRSARPTSTISYDPNVRPSLMGSPQDVRDRIELLVSLADVVKASEEDLAWPSPDIGVEGVLSRWSQAGPRVCVVTQGRDAVVVFVGQTQQRYSTRPTTVVDTVGAEIRSWPA
jgi:fructokinase